MGKIRLAGQHAQGGAKPKYRFGLRIGFVQHAQQPQANQDYPANRFHQAILSVVISLHNWQLWG
jgi:hypothetical protein